MLLPQFLAQQGHKFASSAPAASPSRNSSARWFAALPLLVAALWVARWT